MDHVQIYAGDNTWYNAGNTYDIQHPAPFKSTTWAVVNCESWWAYRPPTGVNNTTNNTKREYGKANLDGTGGEWIPIQGDADRYGIYQASSGRVYTGWKQTAVAGNSYGRLEMFDWNEEADRYYWMGEYGCNVYADTMLLSSIGINVNPGIVHTVYKSFSGQNDVGTIQKIMKNYRVNGRVLALNQNQKDKFIELLKDGHAITTWVGTKYDELYTDLYHWIAVVDIRTSQLGSTYGYDIFALTSSSIGRGHGWQKIETVLDNQQSSTLLGYYILEE